MRMFTQTTPHKKGEIFLFIIVYRIKQVPNEMERAISGYTILDYDPGQ